MKRSALIFLAAATTACQVAQADEISGGSPPDILIYALSDYRESYIAAIMQPLRQKTADHRTLTSDDTAWDVVKTRAARKGREMNAFFASDTNGDDVLDAAELAQPILNYELKRQNITAADTDHDGKISLQEALTFAERSTDEDNQTRDVYPLPRLLALDPNGDGKLTDRELLQLASAAFDHYDLDGDGVLSSAEKAPLNRDRAAALEAEDFRRQMAQCGLPSVEKGDKVYLITTYEGGTLSNVTVGVQDAVTDTATINIATGDDPLYITASSYEPIIWKFTGHVERVAPFYATARDGSGAFGLPGDKVACCNAQGEIEVNGVPSDETSYVDVPAGKPADPYHFDVTVPAGELWVMGDNRDDSADSAYHYTQTPSTAFVPISDVVGRAVVITWPSSRWTYLSNYPSVFARVPNS